MFTFSTQKKSGSETIISAIGKFEDIAKELEAGVADNSNQYQANVKTISELEEQNTVLNNIAERGRSVAAKLRELVA